MPSPSPLSTTNISLPKEVAGLIATKTRDTSTVQALSAGEPRLFRNIDHMVFTADPEAEFVAEGANKSPVYPGIQPVSAGIHKAHVTIRLSDEVRWADEDNQLQIVDALVDSSAAALGRALDYGIYHAVSPLGGGTVSGMTALTSAVPAGNKITASTDPVADLDDLVDAVNTSFDVTGIALSKTWANTLRKLRVAATGARQFPEIPLNLKVGNIEGIPAATSSTVNGARATTPTGVLGILGDFNLIKWGIVRDLGLDIIETGDPDGLGDLKRANQIAYRTEIVYSWAVLDPSGFAVLLSDES